MRRKTQRKEVFVPCPLCGDDADYLLTTHDRLHGVDGKWDILQCRDCQVAFLDPMPNEEAIGGFYPDTYYAYSPPVLRHYSRFRQQRLDHAAALLGYPHHCSCSWFVTWSNRLFPPVLKVPGYVVDGKLLDIGCGSGQYLLNMAQLGWDVCGVELNPKAVAAARKAGLAVQCTTLEQAGFGDKSFDYVRMHDVLEHLPHPDIALREIHRLLRSGGKVEITLPNLDSWTFDLFGSFWFPLEVPRHLFFYTPDALRRLAASCGFAVDHLKVWSHKEVDVVNSMRYLLMDRYPVVWKFIDYPVLWKLYRKVLVFPKALACRRGRGSAMTAVLTKL